MVTPSDDKEKKPPEEKPKDDVTQLREEIADLKKKHRERDVELASVDEILEEKLRTRGKTGGTGF